MDSTSQLPMTYKDDTDYASIVLSFSALLVRTLALPLYI